MEIKTKINKGDPINIKSFYIAKETIKMKRKPSEWEKLIPSEAIDKGLISKYKQLMELSIRG